MKTITIQIHDYPPNLPNISERFLALTRKPEFSCNGCDRREAVIRIPENGFGFQIEIHNGKKWETLYDKTLRGLIVKAERFMKEGK